MEELTVGKGTWEVSGADTILFLDLGGNYTGIHFTKLDIALLCMCVFFSNIPLEKYKVEEGKGRKRGGRVEKGEEEEEEGETEALSSVTPRDQALL